MTAMEQLDLFDFIEDEIRGTDNNEQLRFATVLTCMRDAMQDTMEFFIDLSAKPDKAWHGSGEWSYWWTAAKIVAYPRDPRGEEQAITWEEFADLVHDHPDRQAILDWEQSLTTPKWKDLSRPEELSPYGGDSHPSARAIDHDRPGWDERLEAWETLQSILTDAINTKAPDAARFKLPKQQWQRPRGSCRFCRQEVSVGSYAEGLNHPPMGNMCGRQQLIRNHALYAYQQLKEARQDPGAKEETILLLEGRYEHDAARATEAWNGDGWKEYLK